MTEIIPGRRYRITETYESGTVIAYEGVVTSHKPGYLAELDGGRYACLRQGRSVTVTVEALRDPSGAEMGRQRLAACHRHVASAVLAAYVPPERAALGRVLALCDEWAALSRRKLLVDTDRSSGAAATFARAADAIRSAATVDPT